MAAVHRADRRKVSKADSEACLSWTSVQGVHGDKKEKLCALRGLRGERLFQNKYEKLRISLYNIQKKKPKDGAMTKHLVVVAGNIGVGKTSLTERIGSRLGWWTVRVADNPYLPDFYADMHAWAFHLQIFFLGHRADQYLEATHDPRSASSTAAFMKTSTSLRAPCSTWATWPSAIIWLIGACSIWSWIACRARIY